MKIEVIHTCAAVASLPLWGSAGAAAPQYLETPPQAKPRVVVTADPELDDSNSMVRFLLDAPDFRIEGWSTQAASSIGPATARAPGSRCRGASTTGSG